MHFLKSIIDRVISLLFVGLDLIQANLVHALRKPTRLGGPTGRLGNPCWQRDYMSTTDPDAVLICVFAAYSSEATLSTISYLQALHKAGFEIMVINNMPTDKHFLSLLSQIGWRVYNRKNIGRDIGAYKDGILALHKEGLLKCCRALCIANDSIQFIAGSHGDLFTQSIINFLHSSSDALFSHISHQHARHYQSYFQIFKSVIINSRLFLGFWHRYRPLSSRVHCIHKGEIEASQKVYNKISSAKTLYTTELLLSSLTESNENKPVSIQHLLAIMPSVTHTMKNKRQPYTLDQLVAAAKQKENISELHLQYVAELIESSNPSHVAAFLYTTFLSCPLLKKDLCLAGSFPIGTALILFRQLLEHSGPNLADIEQRVEEFRKIINAKGIPEDFRRSPRQKAIKGVTGGFTYT